MPTPTFQPPQGQQSTAQLQDWIIKLVRDLNYLLENLDTANINRLDANVIIANTITAGKMSVSQLSAIAADLGTITAGIIYGAYIATANGTYPRIEFSSVGNLLRAYLDATHSMSIEPNVGGAPGIGYYNLSGLTGRIYGNSGLGMIALINNIELTSLSGQIDISAPNGIRMNGVNSLVGTKVYYVSDTLGGVVNRKLTFKDGLLVSET